VEQQSDCNSEIGGVPLFRLPVCATFGCCYVDQPRQSTYYIYLIRQIHIECLRFT